MDQNSLEAALEGLPLGWVRFFDRTGSTNDVAAGWINEGAPDASLAIAGEQTQGRGRAGRVWHTPPRGALALSLLFYPEDKPTATIPHYTAVGALALCTALEDLGLTPQIKWPNDVLLGGEKAAGVLAETHWLGDDLQSVVVGVGVNVSDEALPDPAQVEFPACSVSGAAGRQVDRLALLRPLVEAAIYWRGLLGTPAFPQAWEGRLAYLHQPVRLETAGGSLTGILAGLNGQGAITIHTSSGEKTFPWGAIKQLRPVDNPPK
jgi:BirA family biotin operon repressor/biotin-[acetyl-CoA-carboxylase] ligase